MSRSGLVVALFAFVVGVVSVSARQSETTIAEVLRDTPTFSRFSELLDSVGLSTTLESDGETFTVFAPTDDAIAQLPETVLAYLSANPDLLQRILEYHIVPEILDSEQVFAETELTTLEGGALTIDAELQRVNSADVSDADAEASNGVVHTLDSVLIPEIELPPFDPFAVDGSILTAGSSTVRPLTERMAELFLREGFSGDITVQENGTNVGLERFCVNAETDIANASRPIRQAEIDACVANDRQPIGFFVAIDALAIVVGQDNDFVQDLTLDQLARIFTGEYASWREVDAAYPDAPIETYSPGADSGTFVYFASAVVQVALELDADAAEQAILNSQNIQFSEDDNVLVQGVETSPYAIGYFGFAYYNENQDRLRVVSIEGVTPDEATAESGEYALSRPLFIYSAGSVMRENPQVAEFIKYYIDNVREELGTERNQIGYFPVTQDVLNLDRLEWLAALDPALS